ncbi:MAG: DNA primase [Clostridiales bacterium]|jgi:DNA primase|nr:DNA primase [Clostridiales bacterium]
MDGTISQLLGKIDIIDIVSKYVPLKQKGDSFWANCPFHHEKTASFSVSQSKQVYYCFGCKEAGNAISFVRKIENSDFWDGIKILCRHAGLEVPQQDFVKTNNDYSKKEKLYKLLKDAAIHYHHNLKLPEGRVACEYLQSRGVTQDLVIKFGLGVSIKSRAIQYLVDRGHSLTDIVDAGIAMHSNKSNNHSSSNADVISIGLEYQNIDNHYDVFYGRLMVPIINNTGDVVGFGGRDLTDNKEIAKYRNSKQGTVFDKSNIVYSINNLKKIKQSKGSVPYVILVEGYFDVIALHGAGFDTAVACMGTALTSKQARQIKNYSTNVYISFDGDTAGNMATLRSLDILSQVGLVVRVLKLPNGDDPDSFIKRQGRQAYQDLINDADTLPKFRLNTLYDNYFGDGHLSDPAKRTAFAKEGCQVIASLGDPVQQEEYRRLLSQLSGYSVETLQAQQDREDTVLQDQAGVSFYNSDNTLINALDYVMASIVQSKDWVDYSRDIGDLLDTGLHQQIYDIGLHSFKQGIVPNYSVLYSQLDDTECQKLTALLNYSFVAIDNNIEYRNCVGRLRIRALEEEKSKLLESPNANNDINIITQVDSLSKQIKNIQRQILPS